MQMKKKWTENNVYLDELHKYIDIKIVQKDTLSIVMQMHDWIV